MVSAIVPAAGRSRRMGRPKLLLPFGEGTVLGATLSALAGGGARRISVAVRPDDRDLSEWLARAAAGEPLRPEPASGDPPEILVAFNPDAERGMLSSVLAGLAALGAVTGPLLVSPADLPALSPETVAAVLEALTRVEPGAGAGLVVPVHEGRRGHPLGIAPRLVAEIPELDLTVGLRQLLERHPDEVVEVPVDDPGAVRDLDTLGDYEELAGA